MYKLIILGDFIGTSADFMRYSLNMRFSTYDVWSNNCKTHNGWWYSDRTCYYGWGNEL